MEFREYVPKGGYSAHNRRRRIANRIKTFTMAFVGFCLYAAACTVCANI